MNILDRVFKFLNLLNKKKTIQFLTSENGSYYARLLDFNKVQFIELEKLNCKLLRVIEGVGGLWWNFEYEGVEFTLNFMDDSAGGSQLYPSTCSKSSDSERQLLKKLGHEIYTKLESK